MKISTFIASRIITETKFAPKSMPIMSSCRLVSSPKACYSTSVEFTKLVWDSFDSWLRTIRQGIPPSELVVGHVMREAISEFLVSCVKSHSLAKFIVEKQDTDNLRIFSRAS
jgi:hypothetical protein